MPQHSIILHLVYIHFPEWSHAWTFFLYNHSFSQGLETKAWIMGSFPKLFPFKPFWRWGTIFCRHFAVTWLASLVYL